MPIYIYIYERDAGREGDTLLRTGADFSLPPAQSYPAGWFAGVVRHTPNPEP